MTAPGSGVAQRADHDIDAAVVERLDQLGVRSLQDADAEIGMVGMECSDRGGQQPRAAQRHRTDHDLAGLTPGDRRDLCDPCGQFGLGQAKAANDALSRLGQGDGLAAAFQHRAAQGDRQIGDGAVERGLRKAARHARPGIAAVLGDQQQGARLDRGDPGAGDIGGRPVDARGKHETGRSGGHPARMACEQRDRETAFQPTDRLGDGGLRDASRLGTA